MSHRPIIVKEFALSFPHKTCFEGFNAEIYYGDRIGILGKNGSGKSHLLRMLLELVDPNLVGYVPQIIEEHDALSGGERLNKALSAALARSPDILCLDEPTNHLDRKNRRSLMRMLDHLEGTLIVVSHDVELLQRSVNTIWHIEDGQVYVFAGGYHDFVERSRTRRRALEAKLTVLQNEQRLAHHDLMRDQERAKKKKLHGEKKYDGDKLALRSAQGRGQLTTNKNRKRIANDKDDALAGLAELRLPEVIKPKFSLSAAHLSSRVPVVSVSNGSCGYAMPMLHDIHFQLRSGERVLLSGDNGCGKTTFVRAIMADASVERLGHWSAPTTSDIGYLDQHYATLNPNLTALEVISEVSPSLKVGEIRDHLNTFLLRKNEEVNLKVKFLSGGERARLSLAQIAAKTPKLLILDEVTNNLDLATREHMIQVLREYPGAMILISHDEDLARQVGAELLLMSEVATGETR
jgi:ATPase subunit of ABC transporter with duplicated ATPase domains